MHTDLSTISDPKELKALAYDEIANKEQAERNLVAINNRLVEVLQGQAAGGLNAAAAIDASKETATPSDADLGIEDSTPKPDSVG